jgi:sugar-specific transcriptional regulator TrmB
VLMASKKRRQKPTSPPTRNAGPLDRLERSQEALRAAQTTYERALSKRAEAIREASEVHTVAEVADTLGISRSKVYEILGRFRTPKVANAPAEQPMLPL